MANHFTTLRLTSPVRPTRLGGEVDDAVEALPPCIADLFPPIERDDPLSGFAVEFGDPDRIRLGCTVTAVNDGVVIVGDEHCDIRALAELIRRLVPSALPAGFVWMRQSSRTNVGASAGGLVTIDADGSTFRNLDVLLAESLAAARG